MTDRSTGKDRWQISLALNFIRFGQKTSVNWKLLLQSYTTPTKKSNMFVVNEYINNLSVPMNYKHFLLPYFEHNLLHLLTLSTSRYLFTWELFTEKQPKRDCGLF